tara:strand:+ start:451 stop:663 length:213 start_codon:yes stop_codon:yes gene_type:complete
VAIELAVYHGVNIPFCVMERLFRSRVEIDDGETVMAESWTKSVTSEHAAVDASHVPEVDMSQTYRHAHLR